LSNVYLSFAAAPDIFLIDFFGNKCDFVAGWIFIDGFLHKPKRNMHMIHVIATVELQPNTKAHYLKILKENVPNVKAEAGCLEYEPAVDIDSGLPFQESIREDVVTIVEAWESLENLVVHLKTPHMQSYRDAVASYVKKVSIQVMAPA
jgi:quinol monooxygenase YgiN